MALLPIITAPDARLKVKSKRVETVDDQTRQLMDDMLETMYAAPGIGLAAIQVGVAQQIIVMDLSDGADGSANPRYFINPELVWKSPVCSPYEEGCLSVPGQYAEVDRPSECRVRFLDYHGQPQEMACTGLLATCLQHEMDHLEGVLFVDYLSPVKRNMILRKVQKAKKIKASEQAA